jgi:hypothetical protein
MFYLRERKTFQKFFVPWDRMILKIFHPIRFHVPFFERVAFHGTHTTRWHEIAPSHADPCGTSSETNKIYLAIFLLK